MQDGGDADLGAEVTRIAGKGGERVHDGAEQQTIEAALIGADQGIEVVGYGEDDVEVRDRQQQRLLGLAPGRLGDGLALGAVPIAAGVIDGAGALAGGTLLHMPAERGGAAL
jgi:hypothetical protein